ncbi:DUF308 domain-containing protein [Neobacillus massiliamazoniensis]|jgi:hypothetical protein|uniref:Uncharacterized protein n=1 Tax=Neobacillus massiliamazoniensis TaxID=1499688 RepID=A0A0U1NZA6_9BACI|nr:DUF308 domain-containing protein [Neobacillus massiliamazoniensis]CRK83360.1 hypothetical protein BN000_03327 [Neobacillus massiliamazoniensis]
MKKKRFTFRFGFGISCLAIGVLGLIQELHKGIFSPFNNIVQYIFDILIGLYLFLPKLPLIRFVSGIVFLSLGVLVVIQELHKGVFLIFDTSIFSILIGIYLFLSTFFQRKENNYSQ